MNDLLKLFEPGSDEFRRESLSVSKMDMLTKKAVPMDLLFKGPEEQKVSKEEENTFILQVFRIDKQDYVKFDQFTRYLKLHYIIWKAKIF